MMNDVPHQILLIGNPNCGKTTLFNALTGENQRVGNWSGVTVEQKMGHFEIAHQSVALIDLPGVYSLTGLENGSSPDELITLKSLVNLPSDVIINVIDACHLERHLYLTSQLLELGQPIVVALNMIDLAELRGIQIDIDALASQLQCPVVAIQAHQKIGIEQLKNALAIALSSPTPHGFRSIVPASLQPAFDIIQHQLLQESYQNNEPELVNYFVWRILEGDSVLLSSSSLQSIKAQAAVPADADLILADARYAKIHDWVKRVQTKRSDVSEYFTARLDRIVLHRYLAFPIFLLAMYSMFLFAINVGGLFQDFFDMASDAIFVRGTAAVLQQWHSPSWLIALLAYGVGQGINTTLTFIPVLASMFFFLSLLESSGYMARAAFVVDKLMRLLGLPGKSFVPMIVGFGCNVPAIMAARTLDTERDRILTVLMSPFMSCSARLTIYAVFVAAFFPTGGQNIVFSLYLIGILMAVLTGYLLRKTTLMGQPSSLILELPTYHKPSFRRLSQETIRRLRYFIVRAGRLIIPICMLLGGFNALTLSHGLSELDHQAPSILSLIGQWLTPIFEPMGIQADNWPATVGLLTGMLAKEVVIGTLNSLYTQMGHLTQPLTGSFDLILALKQAVWTIPENITHLQAAFLNPVLASAPGQGEMAHSVYGVMVQRFDGKAGAFAYLLFIVLYIPCASTVAAIRQETSQGLMWFSIGWSLVMAYVVAVVFYQSVTFFKHPSYSLSWLIGLSVLVCSMIYFLRYRGLSNRRQYVASSA